MLIGEVARRSGVSTRMLRHYDSLGLVRPTGRTVGGYREYSAEDIRRIFHVEGLRSLGLSLRQIGRALEDPAFAPSELVGDLIRRTEERLRREQELLDRLRTVDASAPGGWEGVLRVVELLHGLDSPHAARRQQAVLAPADDLPVPPEVLARALLAEADQNVAGALRWALARAGDDGVASLADGLRSPEADVRRRAVLALAGLSGDRAAEALAGAMADADPVVRGHAALALGKRGVAAAVPVLVAMVAEGTNDVEAAEVLGELAQDPGRGQRITNALADELAARGGDSGDSADCADSENTTDSEHSANSAVRMRLTQALAELPPDLALGVLRPLTEDGDRAVALLASALLGVLGADPGGRARR